MSMTIYEALDCLKSVLIDTVGLRGILKYVCE